MTFIETRTPEATAQLSEPLQVTAGGIRLSLEATCQRFEESRRLVLGFYLRNPGAEALTVDDVAPQAPQMAGDSRSAIAGDCTAGSAQSSLPLRLEAGDSAWVLMRLATAQECLQGITLRPVVSARASVGHQVAFSFDPFPDGLGGSAIETRCVS
ncbi:hypothetical protein GCM10009740_16670 [Terrabacter terrae]|uniref:Uncharacterized protein n=1 Tax=Terrabacter terrae TaxID=318434 RepID=A0ABN2U3A1_9MICO